MINRAHRRDYLRQILHAEGKPIKTADVHAILASWVSDNSYGGVNHHEKTTLRDLKVLEELDYVVSQESEEDRRELTWKAVDLPLQNRTPTPR